MRVINLFTLMAILKNSVSFNYSVTNSVDWALGGYNGCNGGFNGKVDDVKIYNRPLSAAEILEDYNLTRNSLVAFLPLNGNTIDLSGNGHDAPHKWKRYFSTGQI
ncbi:MAG: LamG domain-containing protein [Ignavibacteriales bacterium]|nr:LamG domain-containing protein [Ignavibacteriales bacterium]